MVPLTNVFCHILMIRKPYKREECTLSMMTWSTLAAIAACLGLAGYTPETTIPKVTSETTHFSQEPCPKGPLLEERIREEEFCEPYEQYHARLGVINTQFFSQTAIAQVVIPVIKMPISDLAMATIHNGQPAIYVSPALDLLSPTLQEWVIEHEMAHHRLGHVAAIITSGGYLHPAYRRAQEADADCFAARAFVTKDMAHKLGEVIDFYQSLPPTIDHPLPEWRRAQITECAKKAMPLSPKKEQRSSSLALQCLHLGTNIVRYNESGKPPIVNFLLIYSNTCAHPLQCTLTVASGHMPPDDPDTSAWRSFDTYPTKFELKPNGTYSTKMRTLTWYRTDETKPYLRYPHPPDKDMDLVECKSPEGSFCTQLSRLIDATSTDFNTIKGAPSKYGEDTWDSTITLPGAQTCDIYRRSVECEMATSPQNEDIVKKYASIVQTVRACIPSDWTKEEIKVEPPNKFTAFNTKERLFGPIVYVILDKSGEHYDLKVRVSAPLRKKK